MSSSSVSHLVQIKHQGKQLAAPKEMNGVRAPQFGNFPGLMLFTHGNGVYALCWNSLHITLPHLHIPCLKKLKAGLFA